MLESQTAKKRGQFVHMAGLFIGLLALGGWQVATAAVPGQTSSSNPPSTPTPSATIPACGLAWRIVPSPDDVFFRDIDAISASDIWTVGATASGNPSCCTAIAHWNGTQWSIVPSPSPGWQANELYAVEAITDNDIWTVGTYGDGNETQPLALHWDGNEWSQVPTPIIPPTQSLSLRILTDVAAVSANDIWAVGYMTNNGFYQSLTMHWDGVQWSVVPSPNPGQNSHTLLMGTTVVSGTVWAVGHYNADFQFGYRTLVLRWDGTQWVQIPSPNPGPSNYESPLTDPTGEDPPRATYGNFLRNISGSSANDIWAVGKFRDANYLLRTLTVHWDGTQWSHVPSPNLTSREHGLDGVVALSPNDVWAVGDYIYEDQYGAVDRTLAMHWDGTQWSVVSSPNKGDGANYFTDVTAVSPQDVWAAGHWRYGDSESLVERYNDPCATPTPTSTGTPPTAIPSRTQTLTPTPTATFCGGSQPLSEGFESGTLGPFVSSGTPGWSPVTTLRHAGSYSAFSPSPWRSSDQKLTTAAPIIVPNNITQATLSFWHYYNLEPNADGGVLEVSTDGGASWSDAAPNIIFGGYTGTIASYASENPLMGRQVWTGDSYPHGTTFTQVAVNLLPYAGQSLHLRFRQGTDYYIGYDGWWIDDIEVVMGTSCGTPVTVTPTISSTHTATATLSRTPTATITSVPTGTSIMPTVIPTATLTAFPTLTATPPMLTVIPTAVPCSIEFTDVPSTSAFYNQIMCLSCMGITSGYSDGTFRPNSEITRGQLAKIASNAAGFNEPVSAQTFEDVLLSNTFHVWIERLTRRSHMTGYPCGGPGEPCGVGNKPYFRLYANATRGQISKVVANAAGLTDLPSGQMFEDVPPSHPFYEWVQRLGQHSMMSGYACGGPGEPCGTANRPYFRPNANATRGQSAKIVGNGFYPDCRMVR